MVIFINSGATATVQGGLTFTNNNGVDAAFTATDTPNFYGTLNVPSHDLMQVGSGAADIGTPYSPAVAAVVTDQFNNPMAGVTVLFTAPLSGASIDGSAAVTAVTNASGVATLGVFANSVVGNIQYHGQGRNTQRHHASDQPRADVSECLPDRQRLLTAIGHSRRRIRPPAPGAMHQHRQSHSPIST